MLCVGWVGGVLVRVDAFFVGLVATAFVAIRFTNYKHKYLMFLVQALSDLLLWSLCNCFSFGHWISIQFFDSTDFFGVDFRMTD